jgi:Uma2 family endonuclease
MVQALTKPVTFADFLAGKPEGKRYELHNGVIIEMNQPSGSHEKVGGFLTTELAFECKRLSLPYFIPKQALVKPPESETAYSPDVLILNDSNLTNELLWEKQSTVTHNESIVLIIEVVSSNWRTDYFTKFNDYESMGISEYWIVDYLALGGRRFLGNPKQPTISVYSLFEGEYQLSQFRNSDRIISPTFSELTLTAEDIFRAGGVKV